MSGDGTPFEGCPYDPYAADTLEDPMTAYADLRARCPVHRYDGFDPPFFTLSRYDDVAAALRDTTTFSSRYGQGPRYTETGGLLSDPPEHTAFRRLLQKAFTPRAVAEMEPFVAGVAAELIDGFVDRGAADLARELASPLPAITIATMLGVPPEDRDHFKRWSDALVEELGTPEPNSRREERRGLGTYIRRQVDQRRRLLDEGAELPDGLISSLVVAEDAGHTMSSAEILGVIVQLLVGGNETTASLITNALLRLLERPALLEQVRADLSLVDAVIDESLRFDAPVLGLFRTTTDDVHLHDSTIPAGAKVMLMYGSANRDDRAFSEPDEFRLDRPPAESRRHLAFGAGVHYCLGASLARMEARHALRGAIGRLPGLRLAGPTERVEAFYLWGRRTLPVTWDVPTRTNGVAP